MYLDMHTHNISWKVQYYRPEIISSHNPCRNSFYARNVDGVWNNLIMFC